MYVEQPEKTVRQILRACRLPLRRPGHALCDAQVVPGRRATDENEIVDMRNIGKTLCVITACANVGPRFGVYADVGRGDELLEGPERCQYLGRAD
jgi:hypothetical protein